MTLSSIFKRVILSTAVTAGLLLSGGTALAAASPESMGNMGHANNDIASCIERHQVPSASTGKDSVQFEEKDNEDPEPQKAPYFVAFAQPISEPEKPYIDIYKRSSFRPPDIIILTTKLRI